MSNPVYNDADFYAKGESLSVDSPVRKRQLFQYLDSVGDGSGIKNLIGDYSGAPTTFKIAPGAGEIFILTRMLIYIEDAGSFDTGSYANGVMLTNGISLEHDHIDGVVDMMAGIKVTNNGDWAGKCKDVDTHTWGAGNEFLTGRWSFDRTGQEIALNGDAGQELRISLNDDFSGIAKHEFMIQGFIF